MVDVGPESYAVAYRIAEENLRIGLAVVADVDRASLPYLQLPERLRGRLGHFV